MNRLVPMLRGAAWLIIAAILSTGCDNTSIQGESGNGGGGGDGGDTYTVERTSYNPPPEKEEAWLVDDQIGDKHPEFLADLVDRRPLDEWQINLSQAIIALDVPMVKPDSEQALLTLYPSYAAAIQQRAAVPVEGDLLPSVNMIDGKVKQFDDGLYAAIDQANFEGVAQQLRGLVDLVEQIHAQVPPDHDASAFLAAGLQLAGREVPVAHPELRDEWVSNFESNPIAAKPISFYTWSKTLEDTWRFMRFFQVPLGGDHTDIVTEIARVLRSNPELMADYDRVIQLYSKLTNPYVCLTMKDVVDAETLDSETIAAMCQQRGLRRIGVALLPASTSREQMLFEALFAEGVPANANLMRELVERIRSGKVNLEPTENSGWYEYQVYALETLLLPEKGEEREKLLLSKAYKKRMLEAFKALITKRRETHARQLDTALPMAMAPERPTVISPRLRIEPCPSYYLRTARSYAFLKNLLEANVGSEVLETLHGLKKGGTRESTLAAELDFMRDLFYGLYLVSAEDIGLRTNLSTEELPSPETCYETAVKWIETINDDADLAEDTRVSIPIMVDPGANTTRLWVTLGVRLTKLDARYATPPSLRPSNGAEDWSRVESHELGDSHYLIAVDEFAEVQLPGIVSLTREQLRQICDQAKTKEAIIKALQNYR